MGRRSIVILTLLLWWAAHAPLPSQMDPTFIVYGQSAGSGNGTITLSMIAPSYAAAGSPGVTITLTGSGFVNGVVVYADAVPLTTQYVSSTTVTALIPSSKLATPGDPLIRVQSSANNYSGGLNFEVLGPTSLSQMFPNSATPGTTFVAQLSGGSLEILRSLSFSGSGVTATVLQSSLSSSSAFASITIAPGAALGPRTAFVGSPYTSTTTPALLNVVSSTPSAESSQAPLPIPDVESGTTRTGYIVIATSGNQPTVSAIMGMVHNGVVLSQASLLGLMPSFSEAIFSADQLPVLGRSFGIAVVNTANAANDINITMVDENGISPTSSIVLPLAKFGQSSHYLSELFPGFSGPFHGSLQINSSQPFAALGLSLNGAMVSPVAGISDIAATSWATPLTPALTSTLVIPQFALGGGWATQLNVLNSTPESINGSVGFFGPDGSPLVVRMNGLSQSVFSFLLPVAGTFVLAPRDANGQTPF